MYKFLGESTPKIFEGRNFKSLHNFAQLSILTTNILGTDRDIENLKQTSSKTILTRFSKKLMNFSTLTKKLQAQMLSHSKSTMHILHCIWVWAMWLCYEGNYNT